MEYQVYARQRTETGIGLAEDRGMNTRTNMPSQLWFLVGTLVAILLVTSAIAAVTTGRQLPIAPASDVPHARARQSNWEEGGVVVSIREIDYQAHRHGRGVAGALRTDGKKPFVEMPAKRYEVTVRMRDGSSRVFIESTSAHWRFGERIILIENADRQSG